MSAGRGLREDGGEAMGLDRKAAQRPSFSRLQLLAVPQIEVAHAGLSGDGSCGPSMLYAVRLTMVQSVRSASGHWLAKTP